jgi:hypothetical protein
MYYYEPEIQIALQAQPAADRLHIDYTFTNVGDRPLFVLARAAGRRREPLPHQAYVAFHDKQKMLHLFLGIPPIPRGLRVYVKVIPYSSLLRPGQSMEGHLEFPAPVTEWQPYLDPEAAERPEGPDDFEAVEARRVLLSTEYFGESDLIRLRESHEAPGYYQALGSPTYRTRAMLDLTEPIPVRKRRGPFERF